MDPGMMKAMMSDMGPAQPEEGMPMDGGDEMGDYEAVAADLIDALKAGDPRAVADLLRTFVEAC